MDNKNFIPLSTPNICGNEDKYVSSALREGWVSTGGKYIVEFENAIAKYVNASYAVSCQSGTAGLHLALLALDCTSEHEVIVPTLTFIAAVNPVAYINASPIFMDCDDSLCMDAEKLRKFCETECTFDGKKLINKTTKKHIKALIVVHVFGNIADMDSIMETASKYNILVIEDSTEALGSKIVSGKFSGKYAGTIGNIGVYSFNGNKIITTGGGGMVVTEDEEIRKKVLYLSTQAKDNDVYYLHNTIGYNYRMTNVQAAMGLGQLELLDKFIETKRNNFSLYKELLSGSSEVKLLDFTGRCSPNYWFYALFINDNSKSSRDELLKALVGEKIQTRPIWGLIHEQKPYLSYQSFEIEKAKYYYEHVLNIPCSSNLCTEDVKRVAGAITSFIK